MPNQIYVRGGNYPARSRPAIVDRTLRIFNSKKFVASSKDLEGWQGKLK